MIQIHPTLNCNNRCSFCSYRESRGLTIDDCRLMIEKTSQSSIINQQSRELPYDKIEKVLYRAKCLGYTELKISGGGEPLLYKRIISLLCLAKYSGYYTYLQTNGTMLSMVHKRFVDDVRISIGDGIDFAKCKTKHFANGYNYVVTANPDYDNLNNVIMSAINHNQYVKITQDDTDIENAVSMDEIRNHIPQNPLITLWDVFSYQEGTNPCESKSPLLGADGYWYPCCRTQYAKGKDLKTYDAEMRIGNIDDDLEIVTKSSFDGSQCNRCYYDN